jgi:ABC-type transport system substrate-binding protein
MFPDKSGEKEKMGRLAVRTVILTLVLVLNALPVYAFVIPPNPSTDDSKWELFGPHIKGINIVVYTDTTAEWTAMDAGAFDLDDWALDTAHLTEWSTNNGPFTLANYGGEAGMFELDLNNNATFQASDSGSPLHNPTSELPLRQAIAYCMNRSYVVGFTGGLALPMYTMVPAYMGSYVNPDIAPGQPLQALTYGGYKGDLVAAAALLDAFGYTVDGSGWRIDPVSQGGTGAELNLIFYSRSGDRGTLGDDINANLNAIHIKTDYHSHVPRSTVTGPVFAQEYYNIYTGGWTGIGPDPDYLCDLYNGSNYYHPGSPPNYLGVNDNALNVNLTTIELAHDLATGLAATLDAQVRMAQIACIVPAFCRTGYKAFKNVPHETSTNTDPVTQAAGNWKHLVNQKGIGENSWWSTLDMQTYGNLYPNLNAWYGFSSTVTLQNVIYAQWCWDTDVLGRIYDSGYARDPYTLQWSVPQLYKTYTVGSWKDPVTLENKTSVTVTLRPDVYWQDGHPFTVADVYYTLVEFSKDLLAKGFPPPTWYPTVQYMRSVEIIDDYNIQILLDVQSAWAAGWVIGSVVIPKHIWKPIVDSSINDGVHNYVQGVTPDPNIIGTGPFRWHSGIGDTVGSTVVLTANTPGSVEHGITSPGYYLYCPVYADINPPNGLSKVNILPTDPNVVVPLTLTLRNLWTEGNLIVNKYLYVNGVIQPTFPHDVTLAPITPYPLGTSDVEVIPLTLAKKTLTTVKLAVHIKGPTMLDFTEPWKGPGGPYHAVIANPWISQWINVTLQIWVTIKQDIGGTTLYDVLGYTSYPTWLKNEAPAPDLKVDIKDISLAAKAFGTIPGAPAWNAVADVNGDYKIDIKDIANIAKQFGY